MGLESGESSGEEVKLRWCKEMAAAETASRLFLVRVRMAPDSAEMSWAGSVRNESSGETGERIGETTLEVSSSGSEE